MNIFLLSISVVLALFVVVILGFLFGLGFWTAHYYVFSQEWSDETQRSPSEVD